MMTARSIAVDRRSRFLITVDTEGDNLWARPRTISTRNANFLPRFQSLCEAHRLKPTYLVTYEMAKSGAFREFGRDVLKRGAGEIGAHPHAWSTPPLVPLTPDDLRHQPYLMEYPESLIDEKVSTLSGLLEDTFGVKMVSHRAGRWGFNTTYARILVKHGYKVDCSVTPGVSWRRHYGDPSGSGGSDYTGFPEEPYFVDLDDIRRPGPSPLLEVPMTVVPSGRPRTEWIPGPVRTVQPICRVLNRFLPAVHWLRPDRRNGRIMRRLVGEAVRRGRRCVEFMIHSSELMPGGSPLFPSAQHIETLYRNLDALFAVAGEQCAGMTLHEFYVEASAGGPHPAAVEAGSLAP